MPYTLATAGDLPSVVGSVAALNGDLVAQADTSMFTTALIQLYGTFTATVTFQGSVEDTPTNWINLTAINVTGGAVGATATAPGLYVLPLTCRWVRVRVTAYTSGTVNSTALFSLEDVPVIQAGNTTVSGSVSVSSIGAGASSIGGLSAVATATNGANISRIIGAASGVVKASGGRNFGWSLQNTQAAVRYMQFYNKTTAGVPGTDTPFYTVPMAASQVDTAFFDIGISSATGISWAVTTDVAGATVGAASDIVGTVYYA